MTVTTQEIKNLYEHTFLTFDKNIKIPNITIEFYPYTNVNSRIKSQNGKVFVRIAELLQEAPMEIHQALSIILIGKLLGKKIPSNARKIYQNYLNDENFQKKAIEHKRQNGKKIITSPRGLIYNLEEIFDDLNQIYFQNSILKPELSWSRNKTFRRLGHHDPVHNAIIISKTLDDKNVPKYVVEFVVYHEMLHIKHPVYQKNGRRFIHTPEFKRDEEKFKFFDEAEQWIEENALKIKWKVIRKK